MSNEYESFMKNSPQAQQARLGARFVAKLLLDLIPDLRQLLVRPQLAAGNVCHFLFVGHS